MSDPSERTYSPGQAAAQLAVAERTLRYWSRYFAGHLSGEAASGETRKGHRHRRYRAADLVALGVVRDLTGQGVPLARIGDVLAGRVAREIVESTTPTRSSSHRRDRGRGRPLSVSPTDAGAPINLVPAAALEAAQRENNALQRTVDELRVQLRSAEARIAELELRARPEPIHIDVPTSPEPAPRDRRGLGRLFRGRSRVDQRAARRIIRLMAEQLMTRAELAERAGVPVQLLGEILDQRSVPDESTLAALAAGLGVDARRLLQD